MARCAGLASALLIPVGFLAPGAGDWCAAAFAVIGLPVGGNALLALLLWQIGTAAQRRKRHAWWALITLQLGNLALNGLALAGVPLNGVGPLLESPPPLIPGAVVWEVGAYTVLSLLIIVLLGVLRPVFTAVSAEGAGRRSLMLLGIGLPLVFVVGWLLAGVLPGDLSLGSARLIWSADQITGEMVMFPDRLASAAGPSVVELLVRVLGLAVIGYAMRILFRAPEPRQLTADDELRVRELLAEHGEPDSVGYFATRRDRSLVFAPSGRAAVAHAVFGDTSLASGDPIGPAECWPGAISEWLAHIRRNGWTPCVVAVSGEEPEPTPQPGSTFCAAATRPCWTRIASPCRDRG